MEGESIIPALIKTADDRDENPKISISGLPEGVSFNTETNTITGTPVVTWSNGSHESEAFLVEIESRDYDGNVTTKSFTITVLRDTDDDGIPDTQDPDDDGDCILDEHDADPKLYNQDGIASWEIITLPKSRYDEGDPFVGDEFTIRLTAHDGVAQDLTWQEILVHPDLSVNYTDGTPVPRGTSYLTLSMNANACLADLSIPFYGFPTDGMTYSTDAEGTYPESYSQDSPHVRNAAQDPLEYDEALLSKSATGTETPGRFTIDLQVDGRSDPYRETTDLVIVLDNSNSMEGRVKPVSDDIKALVEDLLDPEKNAQGNLKMALVTYGSVVFNGEDGVVIDTEQKVGNKNLSYKGSAPDHTSDALTTNAQDIVNLLPTTAPSENKDIENYRFLGGTFTQAALEHAAKLLEKGTAKNKMIITVTDGVPTRSFTVSEIQQATDDFRILNYQGVQGFDTSMIATAFEKVNHLHQTNRMKGSGESYWLLDHKVNNTIGKFSQDYLVDGYLVDRHGFATMSYARMLQREGIEMASMGIALEDTPSYHGLFNPVPKAVAVNNVMNLGSNEYLYSDVQDPTDLDTYLYDLIHYKFRLVRDGTVTDPMGEQTLLHKGANVLDPSEYTLTASDGSTLVNGVLYRNGEPIRTGERALLRNVKLTEENGELTLTGLNLGEGMWVKLSYDIHLRTEAPNFQQNFYYQTNGTTTLNPNLNDPTVLREFPIPSVSGDLVDLTIEKRWQDPFGNPIPDEKKSTIQFTLYRTHTKTLIRESIQTGTLQGLDGWVKEYHNLLSYDNIGDYYRYSVTETGNSNYRVSREVFDDEGSLLNTTFLQGQDGTLRITNTLVEVPVWLKKVDGTNSTALEGAEFQLYEADRMTKIGAPVTSTASGLLDYGILGVGSYFLEEISTPEGYVPETEWIPLVIKHNGEIELAGSTVNQEIENYKEILTKIAIKKVTKSATGGPVPDAVSGASFRIEKKEEYTPGRRS